MPVARSTFAQRAVAVPVALAAIGLLLTACGSKAGDTATGAAGESCVDTSGDTIKVGSLNSLSGTMAISEVTVRDSIALAVEQINASGGVLGKQITIVAEDGASEPRCSPRRQRSSSAPTVSLRCSAAGRRRAARRCSRCSRTTTHCCTTRCSTRAWSRRRTSSTPEPPPTSRSCRRWTTSRRRASNPSTWSAATTCSRRRPTASSAPTPKPTVSRSRARTTPPRSARPTSRRSSTRCAPPTRTRCSTPSTAIRTSRSSASTPTWA